MKRDYVILLIEDNKHDEMLTLRALRQNHVRHQVIVCRDGEEALDWLFRQGSHSERQPDLVPQVILLDLKLPKLDGFQVLQTIRSNAQTKHFPVVVLTTSKEESDVVSSYDLGANSYVQKPVNFNDFSEAIKSLGLYWLVLNETPYSAQI